MGRRLRFVPEGHLVEITCRTVQGRFLLKPSAGFEEIFVGILARAAERYPVNVHAYVCMSNHYHLLVTPKSAQALAAFMRYVNSNLSREAARLHGWRGPLFSRRYQHIVVSNEEAAQVERLRYLLSHGCKEGLVASPIEWPGAHCARALLDSGSVQGVWYDRSRECLARHRGHDFDPDDFATRHDLELALLPCWKHLPNATIRSYAAELVEEIEEETRVRHLTDGTRPSGVRAVLALDPHASPKKSTWSPAPLVHAATRVVRDEMKNAYAIFCVAFREAASGLRAGDRSALFPEGAFPPPVLPIPLHAPG